MDTKITGWSYPGPGMRRKVGVILILSFIIGIFLIEFNFQQNFQPLHIHSNYSLISTLNNSNYSLTSTLNNSNYSLISTLNHSNLSSADDYSEYIVHTKTCAIPRLNPRDPEVLHIINTPIKAIDCGLPALTSISDRKLIINIENVKKFGGETLNDVKCCLQVFTRGLGDYQVRYSTTCVQVENGTVVTDEFVRVICVVSERRRHVVQFHFTIPAPDPTNVVVEEKEGQHKPWNVMLIGIDSVSRLNFERFLPKTRKYLLDSMGAVEMFGHTKVGDNTLPNLAPILAGISKNKLLNECTKYRNTLDDCTSWIWNKFSQKGYRTMYGEDSQAMSTFNLDKRGFNRQPTDFYLRPFFIAGEEVVSNIQTDTWLCLGAKPMHEVTLDWGSQFMKVMKDVPYYGIVWSNSLTHDDGNMVQLTDDYLYQTLAQLHTNGYLKRTVVFVISDHGRRFGPMRTTKIGSFENRLPALYVYLPEQFRQEKRNLYDNLRLNSHRLTSQYDIYRTCLHILDLSTNYSINDENGFPKYGVSLLETVPEIRTCQDAGIESEWCACDKTVDLDVGDPLVMSIAEFVVNWINNALKDVMDKCARLTLKEIVKASQQMNIDMLIGKQDFGKYYYRVTVTVEPSNATFEATVLSRSDANEEGRTVDGDMTRLNLYKYQSHCMHNVTLKAFCYCLNQTL